MPDMKSMKASKETTYPIQVTIEGLGTVSVRYRRQAFDSWMFREAARIDLNILDADEKKDNKAAMLASIELLDFKLKSTVRLIASWDLKDNGVVIPITLDELTARENDKSFQFVLTAIQEAIQKDNDPNPVTPAP
jgi:hypothetical protein